MKSESELCKICPLREVCDLHLEPGRADGRRPVDNNPWQCRHIVCPKRAGLVTQFLEDRIITVLGVKLTVNNPENCNINIKGKYCYFHSPDKKSVRRVPLEDWETKEVESQQDGEWYTSGQLLKNSYIVDPQYFPFKRLRRSGK